jgi:hypothetical protein
MNLVGTGTCGLLLPKMGDPVTIRTLDGFQRNGEITVVDGDSITMTFPAIRPNTNAR